MVIGLTVCYAFGTVWFIIAYKATLKAALATCVVPFLLPECGKILLAALLTNPLCKINLKRHKETQGAKYTLRFFIILSCIKHLQQVLSRRSGEQLFFAGLHGFFGKPLLIRIHQKVRLH